MASLLLPFLTQPHHALVSPRREHAGPRAERPVPGVSVDGGNWSKEETMALAGVVITFVGFVVAVASLGITGSNAGRMVIVLAGIAVSLFGIMGVLNPAYMKNAIWKK